MSTNNLKESQASKRPLENLFFELISVIELILKIKK
tara:strand:- start:1152 stop:1259 length:108 start_codon:yes stop_codon:yes gene_type:complete